MGKLLHSLKESVSFIAVILFLILYLLAIGTMFYGVYYLQSFINMPYFGVPIYYLTPAPIVTTALIGIYAYIWYIILAIIITISLIFFFYYQGMKYFREFIKKPFSYKKNGFQEFVELYSLILFIDLIVIVVMSSLNYKPTNPIPENYPIYALMLALLHASVYEEFLVRFLILGVPVFIWRFAESRSSGFHMNPLRIFGGGYKFGIPEITFLLISSTIFGLAHVSSWGWWKFFPAFLGGLALGYLYLKYGLHVSILFHFANDFVSVPILLDKSLTVPTGLIFLALILSGVVFTISYSIRILHFFGLSKTTEKKMSKLPPPPPPWINMKCPNCGGTVFTYLGNGKYKCVSCGTVFEIKDDQTQIA